MGVMVIGFPPSTTVSNGSPIRHSRILQPKSKRPRALRPRIPRRLHPLYLRSIHLRLRRARCQCQRSLHRPHPLPPKLQLRPPSPHPTSSTVQQYQVPLCTVQSPGEEVPSDAIEYAAIVGRADIRLPSQDSHSVPLERHSRYAYRRRTASGTL